MFDLLSPAAPRRTRRWLLLATLALSPLGVRATPDAQQILRASDKVRNPAFPFGASVALVEYRAGKQTDSAVLGVYSKEDPVSGQFRTLIRFAAPARDVNKLMLKSGNDVWFYDPESKATIRIPTQQRLLGQAANGDVVTVNLAKDYKATWAAEEEVVDGDRQPRRCHKLALAAASPDVTYDRIELWVDKDHSRPVKARFFSESGRLLKTAYYRRYENQLGALRPTETVIIDGLDPSWVTVMRGSQYARKDIPESWFQRDYLAHFKPD